MGRRRILPSTEQGVRMLSGRARDDRVSDVHKSSQASFAGADDVRLQLERKLNDTADRLRQVDLVSPDGAQSSLGRQSGCDVLDEAEVGPFRADGTPAKAQVSVMNEETNRETACATLYEVLAAIEGQ